LHNTGIGQQVAETNRNANDQYDKTRNYYLARGLKAAEADRMAGDPIRYDVNTSAAMLAYKDIYLVMAVVCFLPVLIILLTGAGGRSVQRVEVEPIPV
jgi:DHA2 family multidrug resistance protein